MVLTEPTGKTAWTVRPAWTVPLVLKVNAVLRASQCKAQKATQANGGWTARMELQVKTPYFPTLTPSFSAPSTHGQQSGRLTWSAERMTCSSAPSTRCHCQRTAG